MLKRLSTHESDLGRFDNVGDSEQVVSYLPHVNKGRPKMGGCMVAGGAP